MAVSIFKENYYNFRTHTESFAVQFSLAIIFMKKRGTSYVASLISFELKQKVNDYVWMAQLEGSKTQWIIIHYAHECVYKKRVLSSEKFSGTKSLIIKLFWRWSQKDFFSFLEFFSRSIIYQFPPTGSCWVGSWHEEKKSRGSIAGWYHQRMCVCVWVFQIYSLNRFCMVLTKSPLYI